MSELQPIRSCQPALFNRIQLQSCARIFLNAFEGRVFGECAGAVSAGGRRPLQHHASRWHVRASPVLGLEYTKFLRAEFAFTEVEAS